MKKSGLGWQKDLGLVRLLRNDYNVNYNVNLRMFLKGKKKCFSFYWVPIHGPNRRKCSLPKNNKSHNWMCRPCLIPALLITWPISHVQTKLSEDSALVCCPHKCIPCSLTPSQLVSIWVVLSVRALEEESMLGQTSYTHSRARGSQE